MRFEVTVNGERRCIAGFEFGVLNFNATWVKRNPAHFDVSKYRNMTKEQYRAERADLRVGGIDLTTADSNEHVIWIGEECEPGDAITLRVLAPGEADEPVRRQTSSCALPRRSQSGSKPNARKTGIAYSIIVASSIRDRLHEIFEKALLSVTSHSEPSMVHYEIEGTACLEILFSEEHEPRDQPSILLHLDVDDGDGLRERLVDNGITPSCRDAWGDFNFSIPGGIAFHVNSRQKQSKN